MPVIQAYSGGDAIYDYLTRRCGMDATIAMGGTTILHDILTIIV